MVACMVVGIAVGEVVATVAAAILAVGVKGRLEARCWVSEDTAAQVVGALALMVESCEVGARSRAGGESVCDAGLNHVARSSCHHCACC